MRKHIFKQTLSLVLVFSMAISPITAFATESSVVEEATDTTGATDIPEATVDTENDVDSQAEMNTEIEENEDSDVDNNEKIEEIDATIENKQEDQESSDESQEEVQITTQSREDTVRFSPQAIETTDNAMEESLMNLTNAVVPVIGNQLYTGKEITPTPSVSYGDTKLVKDIDYLVTYRNNIQPGKATVIITGIESGNYTGTKTVDFYITPTSPTNIKAKKITQSALTLSWNKVDNATGYMIYQYNEKTKTYKKVKTITNKNTTSFTQKKLDSFTTYRYKLSSYVTVSDKLYEGSQSKQMKGKTKIEKANIRSVAATNTSVKISWDKVSQASGYMVYMSTSKKGKYKKVSTQNAKKTSYTKDGLTSGATYYFKVRAYIKVNKSKQYGEYSKVKKSQTRTDIRLESLESQILSQIQTAKTNQYKKSKNQVMTKAHYTALEELCVTYSSDQLSDSQVLKAAKKLKFKKYKGTKKVVLKSSHAMKLQFSGVHMNEILATVHSQIKGKRDFVYVRVYYNAGANQTIVYLINGGIS